MKVLALIPAYNAESSIAKVVEGLLKQFDKNDILVIDDGSDDRTSQFAEKAGATVIKHPVNKGKGEALKTGFKYAIDNDYFAVLTLDADMQHPPEFAKDFIDEMSRNNADILIGNRLSNTSAMPIHRRFSNRITSFLVRLWTGYKITDSQNGYRLIKTWVLEKADLRTSRYQLETEIILESARLGAKFLDVFVPTIYNENKSKINPLKDTMRFIALLVKYPFRKNKKK